jgi:hypothetical protein
VREDEAVEPWGQLAHSVVPAKGRLILFQATPRLLRNILHGPAATYFPVVPSLGVQQERTHGGQDQSPFADGKDYRGSYGPCLPER